MRVVHDVASLRSALAELGPVAFVPTMGSLHAGHLSLVRLARRHAAAVVASIFVNRLQFHPGEDFERYPRTLERDCELLAAEGTALLFAPDERVLYPVPQTYLVRPPPIAEPFKAQITGLPRLSIRLPGAWERCEVATPSAGLAMAARKLTSAPDTNALVPKPVSTTAEMRGSSFRAVKWFVSCA